MNSMDALYLFDKLPVDGMNRYFTWLVRLNCKLKTNFQLSDKELLMLAKAMDRTCK